MGVVHPEGPTAGRAAHRQRCVDDRGAALAEAAFVTPVLLLLIFGIFEYGGVFRDYLSLGNGLRAASRTAAVKGNAVDTDWAIIQVVKKETAAVPQNQIQRLVIFRATGPSSTVPSSCLSAGAPGIDTGNKCNIYSPTRDWSAAKENYDCVTTNWATGWCPTTRKVAATANGFPVMGPPDFVGVYLEINHPMVTGLFGTAKKVSDTQITRIEPQTQQ